MWLWIWIQSTSTILQNRRGIASLPRKVILIKKRSTKSRCLAASWSAAKHRVAKTISKGIKHITASACMLYMLFVFFWCVCVSWWAVKKMRRLGTTWAKWDASQHKACWPSLAMSFNRGVKKCRVQPFERERFWIYSESQPQDSEWVLQVKASACIKEPAREQLLLSGHVRTKANMIKTCYSYHPQPWG